MWTGIWTLLAFVLLLFHGDAILAFAAEQLRARRAHRLDLQREKPSRRCSPTSATRWSGSSLPAPTRIKTHPPIMPEQPERRAVAPSLTPMGAANANTGSSRLAPRCS
jgi:hypothetical protein